MPYGPAARLGDLTSHGSPLAPGIGSTNVLIGSMPAWRALMDFHACPIVKVLVPDVGGIVMMGSPTVLINSMMACRVLDMVVEIPGGPNPIAMGATNVFIGDAGGGAPGAAGGAAVTMAKPSLANMPVAAAAQAQTLIQAAKAGVPFCEKCQHITDGLAPSSETSNQDKDEAKDQPLETSSSTADKSSAGASDSAKPRQGGETSSDVADSAKPSQDEKTKVHLCLEFPVHLMDRLPDDFKLTLSGPGLPAQERAKSDASREDDQTQFEFEWEDKTKAVQLEASGDGKTILLWRQHVAGDLEAQIQWGERLQPLLRKHEEVQVAGNPTGAGSTPADLRNEELRALLEELF